VNPEADADSHQTQWGDCSVTLGFSFARVSITGFSSEQLAIIQRGYGRFIENENQSQINAGGQNVDLICSIDKLVKPHGYTMSELSVNGIYTVKKVRQLHSVELFGFGFKAILDLNNSPHQSTLSIMDGQQIATSEALENFLRPYSAHFALKKHGILLHSAGFVLDEHAWIVVGRSGAGKTTLSRKAYRAGAKILSDDINLLLPQKSGGSFAAQAVPFTGEFGKTLTHVNPIRGYPVKAIILLGQSTVLRASEIDTVTAVSRIITGAPFVNCDEHESERLFDNVQALVKSLPVIDLVCRKSDGFSDIMHAVNKVLEHIDNGRC